MCSIFNSYRIGSIGTDRNKLQHQDINYSVEYQHGKKNQSDYPLRHGKPFCDLTEEEQNEADELHNLLYLLHTTPVTDHLGISLIAKHTEVDPILSVTTYCQIWQKRDTQICIKQVTKIRTYS